MVPTMSPAETENQHRFLRRFTAHEPALRAYVRRLVPTRADADARTVRFYLNGSFDKETRHDTAHPARLGRAQIGNWNQHDRKLSGRLDELLLLGRAMKDTEVRALYEAGNPYR